jgi:hypothetical protein
MAEFVYPVSVQEVRSLGRSLYNTDLRTKVRIMRRTTNTAESNRLSSDNLSNYERITNAA